MTDMISRAARALQTKARSMERDVRLSELTDDELAELARAVIEVVIGAKLKGDGE